MESAGTVRPREDANENGSASGATERPTKRPRGLGSGGRGAGYSPPEVSFFLSLLEEHLPVTNKEWKAVVRLHNLQFPSLNRTPNSLRRKFTSLCRSVGGADESSLSPDVRRAVHAKRRMKNRGDVPDEDDVPDSDEDDGENDDDSLNGSQHGNPRRRESAGDNGTIQASVGQAGGAGTPQTAPARYYAAPPSVPAPVATTSTMPMGMPTQVQVPYINGVINTAPRGQTMHDRLVDMGIGSGALNGGINDTNLIELIKLQLLQNVEDDRRRRIEELERREEERRHREEERAARDEFRRRYEEERARREQDLRRWEEEREESRRRHEEFMQLILSLVNKQ